MPAATSSQPASDAEVASTIARTKETDTRFWAQTGYRVGQKLDPDNPTDLAMSKVWMDIYKKIEAEEAAGQLALTHEDPRVSGNLRDAAVAHQVAVAHLESAAKAPDPVKAAEHVKAAAVATSMGQESAKRAAARQPPTASPAVAHAAAVEAHGAVRQPPPGVIVFPVGHPVHWHPSAQPAHPDLAMPAEPPADPWDPQSAEDHLALAQAAAAPAVVGDTFANASPKSTPSSPPAHWAYSDYERAGDLLFASSLEPAAVIAFDKDGASPVTVPFTDSKAASDAYDAAVNAPMQRWYVALYDRSKAATSNGRVDQTYFGGIAVEHTTEHTTVTPPITIIKEIPRPPPMPKPPDAQQQRESTKKIMMVAGAAAGGLLLVALVVRSMSARTAR